MAQGWLNPSDRAVEAPMITLERIDLARSCELPRLALADIEPGPLPHEVQVRHHVKHELDTLVWDLRTYVWGRRDTHVLDPRPATWWDHLKHAHRHNRIYLQLRAWGLVKPPLYRTPVVDITAWVPDLSLVAPARRVRVQAAVRGGDA